VTDPPRVLLVIPNATHRALVRAALREVGYDAIGARTIAEAREHPPAEPRRGPVGLILVDHEAAAEAAQGAVEDLLALHSHPPALLVAHTTHASPAGPWTDVLRRPLTVAELVTEVEARVRLPLEARHPIDD
jgi:hypothetical protein